VYLLDLRGSLVDGEDAGGELPEAGEPDVEFAPVRQVHAFKPPAQLCSAHKGKIRALISTNTFLKILESYPGRFIYT
jgi:hypothetical protein